VQEEHSNYGVRAREVLKGVPPPASEPGRPISQRAHGFDHSKTGGRNQRPQRDLVAEEEDADQGEESIEEIFGQLWAIPKVDKVRVPSPQRHGKGMVVWIRKELVKNHCIGLEDCFPVSRFQKIDSEPTRLSFVQDIWGGGDRATYAEILKRIPMAEGGRWVWQVDQPARGCGRSLQSRGWERHFGRGVLSHLCCLPIDSSSSRPKSRGLSSASTTDSSTRWTSSGAGQSTTSISEEESV
jgi:hypothetical protein